MTKVKQYIHTIKSTWSYNHKQAIIIISLITVILIQNFSHLLPTIEWSSTHTAQNEQTETLPTNCDYKCLTTNWVEMRTDEIMRENLEQYRQESRYQALIEANQLITDI